MLVVHAVIPGGSSQPRLGPSAPMEPFTRDRWDPSHRHLAAQLESSSVLKKELLAFSLPTSAASRQHRIAPQAQPPMLQREAARRAAERWRQQRKPSTRTCCRRRASSTACGVRKLTLFSNLLSSNLGSMHALADRCPGMASASALMCTC